jgi:hypothetical protein
VVVHTYNPSYVGGIGRRIKAQRSALGKKCKTLSKRQLKHKRAGGNDSNGKILPSKHVVLRSNTSITLKKKKINKKERE